MCEETEDLKRGDFILHILLWSNLITAKQDSEHCGLKQATGCKPLTLERRLNAFVPYWLCWLWGKGSWRLHFSSTVWCHQLGPAEHTQTSNIKHIHYSNGLHPKSHQHNSMHTHTHKKVKRQRISLSLTHMLYIHYCTTDMHKYIFSPTHASQVYKLLFWVMFETVSI